MKVILRIFIPLCIFSFIAFGISVAILGRSSTAAESANEMVISGEQKTYELTESFSDINIDIGAYSLFVQPWEQSTTKIVVSGGNSDNIKAAVSGDKLNISTTWKWNADWFKSLFSGTAFDTQIQVFVPDKVYDQLELEVDAGALDCDGIKAEHVFLDVSAGKLNYVQPIGHRAEFIGFDVSAGDIVANNAETSAYNVKVSAGEADIYGLTGEGAVKVSAGTANVHYAQVDGNSSVNVSAGNVYLDIPENASAKFACSKSAGEIKIMAGGENTTASDGDNISINGNEYTFDLDVSAGSIKVITSTVSAVEVSDVVVASSLYKSDIETPEEVTAAFEESE